jgi:hypothetical protein
VGSGGVQVAATRPNHGGSDGPMGRSGLWRTEREGGVAARCRNDRVRTTTGGNSPKRRKNYFFLSFFGFFCAFFSFGPAATFGAPGSIESLRIVPMATMRVSIHAIQVR